MRDLRAALLALALPALAGCGGASRATAQQQAAGTEADSALRSAETPDLVPAGYGSLKQDDIAFRLQIGGKQVRVIPLDEAIIRTLSSDSYRALSGLVESKRAQVTDLARRYGTRGFSIWYVQYYGLEADARFSPRDVSVTNLGREFRPVEILPLSTGWGQERLAQRETQTALYLFDQSIDLNQPTTVMVEGTQASGWTETLRRIERERALIRSRASKAPSRPGA